MLIHCSQLPLLGKCPGSFEEKPAKHPAPSLDDPEPIRLGHAGHEVMARHARQDEQSSCDLEMCAKWWEVPLDNLDFLYRQGVKVWDGVKEHFGNDPSLETPRQRTIHDITLVGTPDVSGVETRFCILDWKTGRKDTDYNWQLHGYGRLTGATKGIIAWLRDTESPFEIIDLMPADEFDSLLILQVAKIPHRVAGVHCDGLYCKKREACDEYTAWLQAGVGAFVPALVGDKQKHMLSAEVLGELYPRFLATKQACERYNTLLNDVIDRTGEVQVPGGPKLIREDYRVSELDPAAVLEVLELALENPEDIAKCFKPLKGTVEGMVRAQAPKGKMTEEVRKLRRALDVAGAVTYETKRRRREVRDA